jgi:hypothetical protein
MAAGVNFNYALLDFIKQARYLQQCIAETFGIVCLIYFS